MKSFLEIEFHKFLRERLDPLQPLLLALSGGSDSMALWHLLLRYRERHCLDFRVLHVDHGWRPESQAEGEYLREMVERHGISFHSTRLEQVPERNIEEEGRNARLAFFKKMQQETGAQAVLTGHHRDDQAETVLKRLLEGACLSNLRGLEPEREVTGVRLWRPLLKVSKEQIRSWLKKLGQDHLEDSSNGDLRFLRNRFRHEVWPVLEQNLGKGITSQLGRLAEEAAGFKEYLDDRISPFLERVEAVDGGIELALRDGEKLHLLEARHFLRSLLVAKGLRLSVDTLEGVCRAWLSRQSCKTFYKGNYVIRVHCGRITLQRAPIQCS